MGENEVGGINDTPKGREEKKGEAMPEKRREEATLGMPSPSEYMCMKRRCTPSVRGADGTQME